MLADAAQRAVFDFLARDDAEILEDALEQILLGEKWIEHERSVGRAIDRLEQRPAQRRLSRADVAGDDHEAFAAPDRILQQLERAGVRRAPIEKLRIGRQTERLLGKPVIALVHGLAL